MRTLAPRVVRRVAVMLRYNVERKHVNHFKKDQLFTRHTMRDARGGSRVVASAMRAANPVIHMPANMLRGAVCCCHANGRHIVPGVAAGVRIRAN